MPRAWNLGIQTREDRFFGPSGRPFAEEVRQAWLDGVRVTRKERTFDILSRVTMHASFSGEGSAPCQVAENRLYRTVPIVTNAFGSIPITLVRQLFKLMIPVP